MKGAPACYCAGNGSSENLFSQSLVLNKNARARAPLLARVFNAIMLQSEAPC